MKLLRRAFDAHTALLLIDVQRAIDDPVWAREGPRNNPQAEANMTRLLRRWRERRWPIVHVRHESRESGSTYRAGQPGAQFKDEVAPLLAESVVVKQVNSAFIGTTLQELLARDSVDALVIVGVITNNSVEATARMAGNLGFHTVVVADATATFARRDFAGVLRSAEEVHAMSLANLSGEYATILGTDEVLALST